MRYLNSRQRLLSPIWRSTGTQQITPTEEYFAESLGQGRSIPADWNQPIADASNIIIRPDGTADVIRLHAWAGGWRDHGGRIATDVRVGNPFRADL